MSNKGFGRQDNTEKLRMYIRDDANTLRYTPNDMHGSKFIGGGYNFMATMKDTMLYETRERHFAKYNAMLKAETEFDNIPRCFDKCIGDVTTGLNSMEKNCVRECYLKRLSVRDDMNIYFQQKNIADGVRETVERGA